jgi:galactonate dehydratase
MSLTQAYLYLRKLFMCLSREKMFKVNRRNLLHSATGLFSLPLLGCGSVLNTASQSVQQVVVTDLELLPVRATYRTVWLVVRLHTNTGLSGIGEASDAFGFANTTVENVETMQAMLDDFFPLIVNQSPLQIEAFRQQGRSRAEQGLVSATAFSAIEQALWDLAGKVLEVPTYMLFGGKVRDKLAVYANINRATNPRTPDGFATSALSAYNDGFRAMKAAPFDNFPNPDSPANEIQQAIESGIASTRAMRESVGPDVALMIDCHSFFNIEQAIDIAKRLEPVNLTWYEEPVPPENVGATISIGEGIAQEMAGGEQLFGVGGFKELIQRHAYEVIMPDVKHCGGLVEMMHIAAMAANAGIMVAPHNPSGPVSTAASVQVCAGMANFNYLELQYGEVEWRTNALLPVEVFVDGMIKVPDQPGFGVSLNEVVIREESLPL